MVICDPSKTLYILQSFERAINTNNHTSTQTVASFHVYEICCPTLLILQKILLRDAAK